MDGVTTVGEQEILLEELILSNGKKFSLENKIAVKILKQKPSIVNFEVEENVEKNNIKLNFILKDEDKAIKTANIILLNSEGKELDRKEISSGKIDETLTTELTNKYIVKVITTYNQGEADITDDILLQDEIVAKPRAIIQTATVDKSYIEKGGKVTITYEISTNQEDISYIRINSTDCIANKTSDGKYQITYAVDNTSGVKELIATNIIYSNEDVANVNNTVKIEVLKEIPIIGEIKQQDNINNGKVTLNFELTDSDFAFISGKAILVKKKIILLYKKKILK